MRNIRPAILGIIVLAAAIQLVAWASVHQPVHPSEATGLISGLSFSPYTRDQTPNDFIDPGALRDDLALLATKARAVRTYAATGGVEIVPEEAARQGLSVTLGAWIDGDEERTKLERESAIDLANRYDNVERIIMGNEALFREDVSIDTLIAAMNESEE